MVSDISGRGKVSESQRPKTGDYPAMANRYVWLGRSTHVGEYVR